MKFSKNLVGKSAAINRIRAEWEDCRKCSLHRGRTNVVIGSGNPRSRVLVIGEAPGEQEDKSGIPFYGAAGKIFNDLLESVGLDRDSDMYITNIVACRPWIINPVTMYQKNRRPTVEEIEACSPRLQETFQVVDPLILVLLGNTAASALFPFGGAPALIHNCRIFRVMHPAALLYMGSDKSSNKYTELQDEWKEIEQEIRSLDIREESQVDWKRVLKGLLFTKSSVFKKS